MKWPESLNMVDQQTDNLIYSVIHRHQIFNKSQLEELSRKDSNLCPLKYNLNIFS